MGEVYEDKAAPEGELPPELPETSDQPIDREKAQKQAWRVRRQVEGQDPRSITPDQQVDDEVAGTEEEQAK